MFEYRRAVQFRTLRLLVGMVGLLALGGGTSQAEDWQPQEPAKNGKDWVQLGSGEWLGGTIDLVRDLKLEFDSDDLDNLVIDWEDVAAFRSPRVLTYVFTDNRVVAGTSTMRGGVIRVDAESGLQEFPRAELLSVIAGEPREINFWSVLASLGLTVRAGNTEQQDYNTIVKIKREAVRSRFNLSYQGNYGKVGGVETINNNRGSAELYLFLSRKLFLTPGSFEVYTDRFQNIDYRTTFGAGGGYYIFRQGDVDWSIGVSGGYRKSRFVSVEPGVDQDETTGSIMPQTNLEWDITGDVTLDVDYVSQIGVPDVALSTHHLTALVAIDFLKDIFNLTASFTWDRVESPTAGADGIVPKRDDTRIAFGFGVDL